MEGSPRLGKARAAAPQPSTPEKQHEQDLENLLRVFAAEFLSLSPEQRARYEQPAPVFERTFLSTCSQAVN